jgi:hypothetical protein
MLQDLDDSTRYGVPGIYKFSSLKGELFYALRVKIWQQRIVDGAVHTQ